MMVWRREQCQVPRAFSALAAARAPKEDGSSPRSSSSSSGPGSSGRGLRHALVLVVALFTAIVCPGVRGGAGRLPWSAVLRPVTTTGSSLSSRSRAAGGGGAGLGRARWQWTSSSSPPSSSSLAVPAAPLSRRRQGKEEAAGAHHPSSSGGGSRSRRRGGRAAVVAAASPLSSSWQVCSKAGGLLLGVAAACSDRVGAAVDKFCEVLWSKKEDLVAGAVARGVMVFCLYPVDTIKTRIQMFGSGGAGLRSLSVPALYAGVVSSLIGQMPYGMLVYGFYEVCKDILPAMLPSVSSDGINVLAAVLGDITGSVWLCPSEVIKQQMQSASPGVRTGMRQAVTSCWTMGGPGGFYQGYGGQLMRDIPFRAIQMPLYEKCVEALEGYMRPLERYFGKDFDTWKAGLGGVISGSVAAAITTPLDVVKTRLMVNTYYKGTWDCAVSIARQEGIGGLFAGVVPRVAYIGPSTALFFIVYGAVKEHMMANHQRQRGGIAAVEEEEEDQHQLARLRGGSSRGRE